MPTPTASISARQRCTRVRASGPEIHRVLPVRVATRPSSDAAIFRVTSGRPVAAQVRNGEATARARSSSSPSATTTSMPASVRMRTPWPRVRSNGSRVPTTTREIPAAMTASVQGPVRPVCEQGSSVHTSVAPLVASPAAAIAWGSACGVPGPVCQPSPTTTPSRAMTAPTAGLGLTCPRARSARPHALMSRVRSAAVGRPTALTPPEPARPGPGTTPPGRGRRRWRMPTR